jgi:hypothetical protein
VLAKLKLGPTNRSINQLVDHQSVDSWPIKSIELKWPTNQINRNEIELPSKEWQMRSSWSETIKLK